MKKVLALILGCSMLLSIAACGKKVELPSKKDAKTAAEEEYGMEFEYSSKDISDDEKEAEWVFISEDGTLEVTVSWNAKNPEEFEFSDEELEPVIETETETEPETSETTTDATTEATTTASAADTSAATSGATAPASGSVIHFDDMFFYINGTKFTLGKTTLQDMIDAGVPFEEDDLADAKNNLKANYQSTGFDISLDGEYYHATVYCLNYSDDGMPINECVVNEISIYVRDEEQSVLSFEFPLDMPESDLYKYAGEPNEEVYHYESDDGTYISNDYSYTTESEIYWSGSEYEFDFVNGELNSFRMTWMP